MLKKHILVKWMLEIGLILAENTSEKESHKQLKLVFPSQFLISNFVCLLLRYKSIKKELRMEL